ncbi:MAG: hypothetical protein AAFZ67_13905 [Planctomycetota bacterium]
MPETTSNNNQSDNTGDTRPRSKLLSKDTALKAALISLTGFGVAMVISYLLDDPVASHFKDLEVVCVADPENLHGFVIPSKQFVRHLRSREPITCPDCGSVKLARAAACVSCQGLMPTGAHGLSPDNCPYCDAEQPYPTIGDHASMHTLGSHGEDESIIPLFDELDELEAK